MSVLIPPLSVSIYHGERFIYKTSQAKLLPHLISFKIGTCIKGGGVGKGYGSTVVDSSIVLKSHFCLSKFKMVFSCLQLDASRLLIPV